MTRDRRDLATAALIVAFLCAMAFALIMACTPSQPPAPGHPKPAPARTYTD